MPTAHVTVHATAGRNRHAPPKRDPHRTAPQSQSQDSMFPPLSGNASHYVGIEKSRGYKHRLCHATEKDRERNQPISQAALAWQLADQGCQVQHCLSIAQLQLSGPRLSAHPGPSLICSSMLQYRRPCGLCWAEQAGNTSLQGSLKECPVAGGSCVGSLSLTRLPGVLHPYRYVDCAVISCLDLRVMLWGW